MMRRTIILGTLATVLAFGATQLAAHENYRVIGKVIRWEPPNLQVKEAGGPVAFITVTQGTDIFFHDKPSTIKEIKVGRMVVVDGLGDSIKELDCLDMYIESQKVPKE